MQKNLFSNVEKNLFKILQKAIPTMKVYADDGDTDPADPNTPAVGNAVNLEQIMTQVRKEEKDKLYPRIKKAEEEQARLQAVCNDLLVKNSDLQKRLDTAEEKLKSAKSGDGKDDKVIADLNAEIEKLKGELKAAQEKPVTEADVKKIRDELEAEYSVKLYRTEQLNTHKDTILAAFIDEVQGTTTADIDAAIKKVQEKTMSTKKRVGTY